MRNLAAKLATAGIVLAGALTHSVAAQEGNPRTALQETLVKAVACNTEFGSSWEPIVNDALFNLESLLIEEDPTIPKVDLDVILAELLAEGKAMPATDELKEHCRNVMAAGG